MSRRKQRMCAYGSCREVWDAKGDRGSGSKRFCKSCKPLAIKANERRYYKENRDAILAKMILKRAGQPTRVRTPKEIEANIQYGRVYRAKNRTVLNIKALARYHKREAAKKDLLRGESHSIQ